MRRPRVVGPRASAGPTPARGVVNPIRLTSASDRATGTRVDARCPVCACQVTSRSTNRSTSAGHASSATPVLVHSGGQPDRVGKRMPNSRVALRRSSSGAAIASARRTAGQRGESPQGPACAASGSPLPTRKRPVGRAARTATAPPPRCLSAGSADGGSPANLAKRPPAQSRQRHHGGVCHRVNIVTVSTAAIMRQARVMACFASPHSFLARSSTRVNGLASPPPHSFLAGRRLR